ncbi:hypothetical protein AB0G85_33465 [Streptomyces sioyaensis]
MSISDIGHGNRQAVYRDRHTYVWDGNADPATPRDDHHHIVDSKT